MNFLQQMNNKIEKPWNLRVKKKQKTYRPFISKHCLSLSETREPAIKRT